MARAGITVNALGPDGLPLAADGMDVRRRRARQDRARGLPHAACRRAASASRPISPARCCSSPRRRPISTPATFSTPTAATRRAEPWRRSRQGAHRRHRRRPDGPRHRAGVRAGRPRRDHHRLGDENLDTVDQARIAANLRDLGDDESAVDAGAAVPRSRRSSARGRLRRRGGVGGSAAQAETVRRDRTPRAARHDPRQQHVGDPDHRDHAGIEKPRARARHPLVESAVPGAAGRGDRDAMDVARRSSPGPWSCTATPARSRRM